MPPRRLRTLHASTSIPPLTAATYPALTTQSCREFRDWRDANKYYGSGVRSEQTRFIG